MQAKKEIKDKPKSNENQTRARARTNLALREAPHVLFICEFKTVAENLEAFGYFGRISKA